MKFLVGILLSVVCTTVTARTILVPSPPPEDTTKKRDYPQAALTFNNRGTLTAKLSIEQMAERVKPVELTVLDPYSLSDEIYTGFPLESLFYAIYEQAWRNPETEVSFRLANGTQTFLPGAKIFRYASYLAFERRGAPAFAVLNERGGGKPMDVGPFYLIWDNFREPNLKDLGTKDWTPNIATVDLINFSDRYPRMVPPAKGPAAAKRGLQAFRKHCILCHTMNGDGPSGASDLNYPTSVTEYFSERWLRKKITDPAGLKFNTTMPPLDKRDPNYRQILEDLMAYLKTMAKNKKKPT